MWHLGLFRLFACWLVLFACWLVGFVCLFVCFECFVFRNDGELRLNLFNGRMQKRNIYKRENKKRRETAKKPETTNQRVEGQLH